jgi:UDPglucose--hexose-1-phosphate uridylyltransferase
VVIETPDHLTNPALLSDGQFRDVFLAYRDRLIALAADPALHYASVFKNVGAEAGASLGHCHSQIVGTPLVPDLIARELRGATDYHARHRRCVFCDVVAHELADRSRVVAETPQFVALTAFAGRFAYETWVLPKAHGSRYETITDAAAGELAGLMKRVVRALDAVLAEPAYNWFLHAAPLRSAELPHYHWHFEVMPRTSRPAGFEWGGGCFVNAVAPETAAAELRAATM